MRGAFVAAALWATGLTAPAGAMTSAPEASPAQRAAEELTAAFYGEFERSPFDVDRLMRFYDVDVKFADPTFDIEAEGIAQVRKLYAGAGSGESRYRDMRWEIRRVIGSGRHVAVYGSWAGRFDAKPFSVEFVTLWTFRDGKIVEQKDFFDAMGFDEQVDWKAGTDGP